MGTSAGYPHPSHDGIMNDFILWCVEYLIEQSAKKARTQLELYKPCNVIGGSLVPRPSVRT